LPVEVRGDGDAKEFKVLWTLSTVLGGEPELQDRGWGESLAKGPKIISLVFEKFIFRSH